MKRLSLRQFGKMVAEVLEALPQDLKPYLENVVVDIDEEADTELLREVGFTEEEIAEGETVYGLFTPMPLPDPLAMDFTEVPHRIQIFKRPLEEDFTEPDELRKEIRKTVIHELAHHFGLNERDVGKLGLD